jgi:hypothetical protein
MVWTGSGERDTVTSKVLAELGISGGVISGVMRKKINEPSVFTSTDQRVFFAANATHHRMNT